MEMTSNNKYLKIICGAGNENLKEIEALAYIFASADFDIIDIAAKNDVINAAKNGIIRSNKNMRICVSIGLQSDIHLTKAIINNQKCNFCGQCLSICPQNSIYTEDNKIQINEKNCIGCSKCINICPNNAIFSEHKYKTPCSMLLPVLSEDINYVEFHCSSSNIDLIKESWNQIKSIYKGNLGFCIDRAKLSDDTVISRIKSMIEDNDKILIQADGKPMSGGINDYKSNIQAIAFAELIRSNNIINPLIVSGGTNSKTTEFAKLCGVNIDGVAIGSYARKLVREEISQTDFMENEPIQKQAISKAIELGKELRRNLVL